MRIALVLLALFATVAHADIRVDPWSVPAISSTEWESHPAIDPKTGDLWFVRSDAHFSGWHLMISRCVDGAWTTPVAAPIAAKGLEADPWFSADGQRLWFISSRATGGMTSSALDVWTVDRDARGQWQVPQRVPAPVSSEQAEWFPRPAADGWVYFGSARQGGFGKDDIWRARQDSHGKWRVENAGTGLNTDGAEYEFQTDAAGTTGVLATDNGIWRIERDGDHWKRAGKLDAAVNKTDAEIGPMLSRSGKTLVFSRDEKDGQSGELFVAHLGDETDWPPARCAPQQ